LGRNVDDVALQRDRDRDALGLLGALALGVRKKPHLRGRTAIRFVVPSANVTTGASEPTAILNSDGHEQSLSRRRTLARARR
jgi:hypothetical protein